MQFHAFPGPKVGSSFKALKRLTKMKYLTNLATIVIRDSNRIKVRNPYVYRIYFIRTKIYSLKRRDIDSVQMIG